MKEENFQKKNPEPIFPEESGSLVMKILEKYELAEIQLKGIKKLLEIDNAAEKIKIFESLPGYKISQLVKEYAEDKVSLNEIPLQIAKRLNVSETKSKQIAQDLEKSLLSLIAPLQKKQTKTPGEILLGEKPTE